MALKLRRGLESARTNITPEAGEIIYTTDENKIYVGDGTTAGGDLVAGQKGQKGEAGAGGSTGSDGAAGAKGQKGEVGAAGSAGSDGASGSDGAAGAKGQKGEAGTIGVDGAKGQKGEAGTNGTDGSDGSDGAKGQKGEIGAAGSAGSAGSKGQKGEVGLGFNIAKTYTSVSNLNADSSPSGISSGEFAIIETGDVEDSENSRLYLWNGSAYSYVSDLSGEAGVTGAAGSDGAKGQKGGAGTNGTDGSNGSDGAKGQKGEIGTTGAAGSAGSKGQKGEVGADGSVTVSSSAPSSPSDGDMWFDEDELKTFIYYDDGNSSQWVSIGSDGAKGQKGEVGVTGSAGSDGSDGSDGAKGQKGEVGVTGSTGSAGSAGSDGAKGQKGEISAAGDKGQKGEAASAAAGGDSQKDFTSSGTIAAATPVILNGTGTVSEVSAVAAAFSSSSDSIDVIANSTYESTAIQTFDYIWDSYNDQYIALNIGHYTNKVLYGQVVTVNTASNTMTAGSQQVIQNGIYGGDVVGVDLGAGKILVCYRAVSGYVSAAVITNTGGTLSLGTVVSLQTMQASTSLQRIMDLCTDPDTGTSYLLMGADTVNTNPRILSITVTGTTPALASSADMQADQVSINSNGRSYDANGSQDCRIFWNPTHSKILVVDLHLRKSTVCTVSGTTVTVPNSIALASGTNTTYKGRAIEYHPYLDVYMVVIQDGFTNAPVHMMHATFDGTTFSYPTSSSAAFTISGTGHSQRVDNQIITSSVNAGVAVISCRGEYEYKANMGTYATGTSSYTSISANQVPLPMIYNKTWYTRGARDTSGNISFAGMYGGTDAQAKLKIAAGRLANSSSKASYIGIAQAAVADAASVTVMLPGGISTGHSGLTAKSTYYLADDGALTTTATTVKAGVAIDATTLQVADTLGGLAVNLLSYAPLASPALTGIPTAPTADAAINNTQLATTAYVTTAVAASGGGGAAVNISTSAPSSPSSGDMWVDSSTLQLFVYYNDGSSAQWVELGSQGAAPAVGIPKTYAYSGELEVHTGAKRFYSPGSYTLSSADIHLGTAAAGSSVNLTINKNGSSAGTLTIAAGSTSSLSNSLSVSLSQGDYLTIDITQVGSSTAGSDLYLLITLT